ncbi:MAG: glycosyltransferase family 4 protein [Armatimonadota bacterium]
MRTQELPNMRILFLTPGTGSFHCGTCMRDNTLALALRRKGHDAVMVPLYLQPTLDEPSAAEGSPLFMGGVNVYLHQVLPWWRHLPRAVTRWMDHPKALEAAAKRAGMTQARDLGALTLSMLLGESGKQAPLLDELARWIETVGRPDWIVLSNVLLVGLAKEIAARSGARIACTLHGEDTFLDALPARDRDACWSAVRDRFDTVHRWVAVSAYHADLMAERIGVSRNRIEVVHNGIDLEGYERPATFDGPPTIGYLARMCPPKGLEALIDGYLELRRRDRVPDVRLRIIGACTPADTEFVERQMARLLDAGLLECAELHPNVDRAAKIALLRQCTLLSVPATYGESFGLYLLEALAAGVPVVQPRHAAFPEILTATGGGVLVPAGDPAALASAWEELLAQPERAADLGRQGRDTVHARFSADAMAERFLETLELDQ